MDPTGEIVFSQAQEGLECRAVVVSSDEEQTIYEVQVLRDQEIVWSRPGEADPGADWAFGCWSEGAALPCLFGDIDGDGKLEMLAAVPKSDVSPTVYRIFRWEGDKLELQRKACLLDDGTGEFVWATHDEEDDSPKKWVETFRQGEAHIVHQRRATISHRTLVLVPSRRGFVAAP